MLGTGQMPTEELAFLGALAKFGMGMVHGDGNTRQCMATAVVAYKQAFGFDAPPYTYADFEESDVLVLVGSNLCIAHPIMWERVCKNRHKPEIVVIDPRKTETAMAATQHWRCGPKSRSACCFYGMANMLIARGWIDRGFIDAHTSGFEEFAARGRAVHARGDGARRRACRPRRSRSWRRTIHERKRVSFWWTMGVNQSHEGVRLAQAIIALALMTGNIGRPGTGANSITGQCNAMGSRLFSNTTNLLGGHDFTKPRAPHEGRRRAGHRRGAHPDARRAGPTTRSWRGSWPGKIKGLWIVATNTAHSWINQADAKEVLGRLDMLVVQDMYATTETARTRTSCCPPPAGARRKARSSIPSGASACFKKVARAPGRGAGRLPHLPADRRGVGLRRDVRAVEDARGRCSQILKELSRGQPCDITGIADYAHDRGPARHPVAAASRARTSRPAASAGCSRTAASSTRTDARASSSRRRAPYPSRPTTRYPFALLTGRGSSSQWHTQTRTAKSALLRKLYPSQPYVEINPGDARTLGLKPNEWIVVESRRGAMRARAHPTYVVQPGHLFIPMHYVDTNLLTLAIFDPYSRQPAYKHCAVRVHRENDTPGQT